MASFLKKGDKVRVQVRRNVKGISFCKAKTLHTEEEAKKWAAEMDVAFRILVASKEAGKQRKSGALERAVARAKLDGNHFSRVDVARLVTLMLSATEISNEAGVYFLYARDGKIIYVGQSRSVISRMAGHIDKNFLSARMIRIESLSERIAIEAQLISLLQPPANVSGRSGVRVTQLLMEAEQVAEENASAMASCRIS